MWWVEVGWLPVAHPTAPSLSLLNSGGGENKMKKLLGQDEGREISYQTIAEPAGTGCVWHSAAPDLFPQSPAAKTLPPTPNTQSH